MKKFKPGPLEYSRGDFGKFYIYDPSLPEGHMYPVAVCFDENYAEFLTRSYAMEALLRKTAELLSNNSPELEILGSEINDMIGD